MKMRYVAKGLNFLTMGTKNVLSFFQAFSFDYKVYGSYLVFVETPAWRGFFGACKLSGISAALKALSKYIEDQLEKLLEHSGN